MPSVKQLKEGKFRIFYYDGSNPDGKRNRKSKVIYVESKEEAMSQAKSLEKDLKEGKPEVVYDRITFEDFVDQWKKYSLNGLAEKTKARYLEIVDNFLIVSFGAENIKDIEPINISAYLATLSMNGVRRDKKPGGYSQKTICHHFQLLNKIFNDAVRWKIISENPCSLIKKPRLKKPEINYYNEDEVKLLMEKLNNAPIKFKAFVYLALFSGCRRSELLGLEWRDINWSRNTLKISRTSHYTKELGIYTEQGTKNGTPSRIVTIPLEVMEILKELKAQQEIDRENYFMPLKNGNFRAGPWYTNDRVFKAVNGSPMHPDTPYDWFKKFQDKEDLPELSIHGLRHTNISLLINKQIDVKTIAAEKGCDPTVMLSVYAHVFEESRARSAEVLSESFFK